MRKLACSLLALSTLPTACGPTSSFLPDAALMDAARPDAAADAAPDAAADACIRNHPAPAGIAVNAGPRLVIVNGFPAAELGNTRALRVYLPPSYAEQPDRSYPVLYMHDGQNLFDAATAAYGHEWQVDETVDSLVAAGAIPEIIVVGIDNTPDRINEYTPTAYDTPMGPNGEHGGKGPLYTAFVVNEVKPYIDSQYRTLCGADATALVGSSLGGLISFDMGWTHPDVFGKIGAVSASFWWRERDTLARLEQIAPEAPRPARIWLDGGSAEGNGDRDEDGLIDVLDDMRDVRDRLLTMGYTFGASLGVREVAGAQHNEQAWAERLDDVLLFLLGTDTQPALTQLVAGTYGSRVALQGSSRDQALHVNVTASHANGLDMSVPSSLVTFDLDESIASIDAHGVIRGVAVGTASLQAMYAALTSPAVEIEVVDALASTHQVTFDITAPASTPADKTVTLAGNLNGWQPGIDSFALQRADGDRWTGTFTFDRGASVQFKLTLQPQDADPWYMVEKGATCEEIGNRVVAVDGDKTYEGTVLNWRNSAPCGN